jgi:hypothetical protein
MDMTSLFSLLNLQPGEEAQFLGLNWKFLSPNEKLSEKILFAPVKLCDDIINET